MTSSFLSSYRFLCRSVSCVIATSLCIASASAQQATDMYVYSPNAIAKGCADAREDNFRNLIIAYLPEVERLYIEVMIAAVPESEMSDEEKASGQPVFQDMFWVVTSPGDNPKYHEKQFAMLYADMKTNRITAHEYDGVNNSESYKDMPALGVFEDAMDITQTDGMRKIVAYLDVSAINAAFDTDAWNGVGFTDEAGIWFHTAYDAEFGYRDAALQATAPVGFGSAKSAATYEITTNAEGVKIVTVRGGGGGSTTTTASQGLNEFNYSTQGPYADVTKGDAKNMPVPFTPTPSAAAGSPPAPDIDDVQQVLSNAGMTGDPEGDEREKALAELDENEELFRRKQFNWCTFYEDLVDVSGLGPSTIQSVSLSGTDGGFYEMNAIEAECLSDISVHIQAGPLVEKVIATNESGDYSVELFGMERDIANTRQMFVLPNDNGKGKKFFKYGQNSFNLAFQMIDGRTVAVDRQLMIPRP